MALRISLGLIFFSVFWTPAVSGRLKQINESFFVYVFISGSSSSDLYFVVIIFIEIPFAVLT